jgi:hypothetical protein
MMENDMDRARDMHEGGVLAGKPEGKRPFGKPNYRWGIILK